MNPTIIAGGLKLLGGLLGRKQKTMSPAQSIMSTAQGARDAAKAYGFNALTLLQASNATAGAGMAMGGPPPLASLSVLGDIIEDNYGDEAKTRKEHNRLQNELLRLEVDRSRPLAQVPRSAVQTVGGGNAALGGRPTTYAPGAGVQAGPFGMGVLTPDRQVDQTPTQDISGFMKIRNALTDEDGFFVPGSDGEPLSIGQLPVVMGAWAASEALELGTKGGAWLRDDPKSPIRRHDYGKPDGHTDDGRPFWKMGDGSINFAPWAKKPVSN